MKDGVVVVDLDGTLLDTRLRHHRVYTDAVAGLGGVPEPLSPFWAAKRRAAPWSLLLKAAFGDRYGAEIERSFLEAFAAAIEDDRMLALDRPQPGVHHALARLRAAGRELVLITSRRNAEALDRQLKTLDLHEGFLNVVATGGAAKRTGLDPALRGRLVRWIGDTEEDFASARRLGCAVTLVTNGIRTRGFLAKLGPDELAPGIARAG